LKAGGRGHAEVGADGGIDLVIGNADGGGGGGGGAAGPERGPELEGGSAGGLGEAADGDGLELGGFPEDVEISEMAADEERIEKAVGGGVIVEQGLDEMDLELGEDLLNGGIHVGSELGGEFGCFAHRSLFDLSEELGGGVVGEEEERRGEVFVEIRAIDEGGEGGAFGPLRGEDENLGVSSVGARDGEDGGEGAADGGSDEREHAVGEVDFDVAAAELEVADAEGLAGIEGGIGKQSGEIGRAGGFRGGAVREGNGAAEAAEEADGRADAT